jgi:DNA-binding NarL/FixJ family response regulator
MALRQTRVLVVDDDPNFGAFLHELLQNAGFAPVTVASAEEGITAARLHRPDAAIVDVVLPGRGGYGLCRELREEHGQDLPVIFVSGDRMDPIDRAAGILVGGDDYLVKPVHPEELLARLRRLLDRARAFARPPLTDLSDREVEVLQLVAEGLPPAQVAGRLHISRKTVSSHMQRIFTKLDVHTRAQAVAVAYEAGLIRVGANGHNNHNGAVEVEGHLAAASAD